MNPLWKLFSNFYSRPALRTPTTAAPSSLLSLVWSGADARPDRRLAWTRTIPRHVGKSQTPLQSIRSQLFLVPLQASGVFRARCQGHVHKHPPCCGIGKNLHNSSRSSSSSSSSSSSGSSPPNMEHISAYTPCLLGPSRRVSPLERWISYERCGGGSKHLSSPTRRHFQMLCCCVPTQWYQVIKHPRGGVLIFKTPPTDGILIINWFSVIFCLIFAANFWAHFLSSHDALLSHDCRTIYEHGGNLSFSSKIIIIHRCLFLLSTQAAGHEGQLTVHYIRRRIK